MSSIPDNRDASGQWFTTTHWSIVLQARDGDSSAAFAALERLCREYWRPVYTFVRRQGYAPSDAQDLTQEFLSRFIEKQWIDRLQDRRGKFRSFLLTFLKHFLSDQRDRANALKRGGGATVIPWEDFAGEEQSGMPAATSLTAEQAFEQRWARDVMDRTVEQLRREYIQEGKAELFAALNDLHPGDATAPSYVEIGTRLGMSEQAIKSAVHRLRQRHRALVREEIARTVGDPAEVDEEIRYLISVLGNPSG